MTVSTVDKQPRIRCAVELLAVAAGRDQQPIVHPRILVGDLHVVHALCRCRRQLRRVGVRRLGADLRPRHRRAVHRYGQNQRFALLLFNFLRQDELLARPVCGVLRPPLVRQQVHALQRRPAAARRCAGHNQRDISDHLRNRSRHAVPPVEPSAGHNVIPVAKSKDGRVARPAVERPSMDWREVYFAERHPPVGRCRVRRKQPPVYRIAENRDFQCFIRKVPAASRALDDVVRRNDFIRHNARPRFQMKALRHLKVLHLRRNAVFHLRVAVRRFIKPQKFRIVHVGLLDRPSNTCHFLPPTQTNSLPSASRRASPRRSPPAARPPRRSPRTRVA